MPKYLEHNLGLVKAGGAFAHLIALGAFLVEAVYVFFWGRQAIRRDAAYSVSPDDRDGLGEVSGTAGGG